DPAHARAGPDDQPDATLLLDADDHGVPAGLRAAEHHRRGLPAALRPPFRNALLPGAQRRRPIALATPLLVVRPPRGVHPDLTRVRHRVGDLAGLLWQADLRLHLYRLVGRSHRLPELHRLGAPHVRGRPADHRTGVLRHHDDADRHPDGGE